MVVVCFVRVRVGLVSRKNSSFIYSTVVSSGYYRQMQGLVTGRFVAVAVSQDRAFVLQMLHARTSICYVIPAAKLNGPINRIGFSWTNETRRCASNSAILIQRSFASLSPCMSPFPVPWGFFSLLYIGCSKVFRDSEL